MRTQSDTLPGSHSLKSIDEGARAALLIAELSDLLTGAVQNNHAGKTSDAVLLLQLLVLGHDLRGLLGFTGEVQHHEHKIALRVSGKR